MARDDGEQQAMTSERLAEIESRVIEASYPRYDYPYSTDAKRDMSDLLAEVERQRAENVRANDLEADNERLRAREAALVAEREQAMAIVLAVAHVAIPYTTPGEEAIGAIVGHVVEQARALLASTAGESERSGGDGA